MRVTISMPCYGRPQRTLRAIESICNQTVNGWEALITGDGCPIMADLITSNYFSDIIREVNARGNSLCISNLSENKGGCGYNATNYNRNRATGKYFMFVDNDDVVKPNHVENYLSGIEGTDYDFVYFNTFNEAFNGDRISELRYGGIGHNEIIVRTEFLKQMPPHTPEYGHDWELVQNMMKTGKYAKAEGKPMTYIIKGVPAKREVGID